MKARVLIACSIVVMFSTILVLVLSSNRPLQISVNTFPKAHNYVFVPDEEQRVRFELYVSEDQTYLTNRMQISEAYITDATMNEILGLRIVDVYPMLEGYTRRFISYQKYLYEFEIEVAFENGVFLEWQEAFLHIGFKEHQDMKVEIGSFGLYRVPYIGSEEALFSIKRIRGIVNDVDGVQTLVGLDLSIRNYSNKPIELLQIELLDPNGWLDVRKRKVLEGVYYPQNIRMDVLLDTMYHAIAVKKIERMHENIQPQEVKHWLIPVQYVRYVPIQKVGFRIEYQVDGKKSWFYFDGFAFFSEGSPPISSTLIKTYLYENRSI